MCADFAKQLDAIQSKNRYRLLSLPDGIDFSSNDYLGLREHPSLRRAAIEALESGIAVGSGGSRLLRGHCAEHARLEDFAAKHYGFKRALYFANGYSANYALLTALPARRDIVLFDSLVHASMRDGLYTPSIQSQKILHNDLDAYESAMKKYAAQGRRIFIAVESVYSMDGDFSPLSDLHALALRYGAILIVDEAHGTGVYGHQGKGLTDSLPRDNLITVHTCGKALGVAGGLVCASDDVIEYLINKARPFIYSTAPPPLQGHLTMKAIELCAGSEGEAARTKLMALCSLVQDRIGGSGSQIVPIILGVDERAVSMANYLQDKGYDIRAVRPPTVPEGSARLRLSLNANLNAKTVSSLLDELDVKKA